MPLGNVSGLLQPPVYSCTKAGGDAERQSLRRRIQASPSNSSRVTGQVAGRVSRSIFCRIEGTKRRRAWRRKSTASAFQMAASRASGYASAFNIYGAPGPARIRRRATDCCPRPRSPQRCLANPARPRWSVRRRRAGAAGRPIAPTSPGCRCRTGRYGRSSGYSFAARGARPVLAKPDDRHLTYAPIAPWPPIGACIRGGHEEALRGNLPPLTPPHAEDRPRQRQNGSKYDHVPAQTNSGTGRLRQVAEVLARRILRAAGNYGHASLAASVG